VPALSFPILLLTVSLALARPRLWRLRIDHAPAALLGAALTVLVGAVPVDALYPTLRVLVYPVVAIVSLMVLTLLAEEAGLFELLALRIANLAGGDGRRLFTYLFFAGAAVGSVFTNDAAVLIFTPLVYRLIERVQGDAWTLSTKIPYYFAVLYVANLVGAFVISNPINLIVASFFAIDFLEYARWMVVPALVSMVASYVGLRLYFRRSLPRTYGGHHASIGAANPRFVRVSTAVLGVTLLGFFVEPLTGVPTWAVAASGAASLLVLSAAMGWAESPKVLKGVGWDVIVFVVGIFVVVSGLRNAGLTSQIERLVLYLAGFEVFGLMMVNGLITAMCSAVMNNHSTAYAVALAIEDMPVGWEAGFAGDWGAFYVKRMLVFSTLIGGDLGPKMLPIGSLAALLWFRMLRDRGVEIPYRLYVTIGVPVTLAAVVLSVLALYAEYGIVQLLR